MPAWATLLLLLLGAALALAVGRRAARARAAREGFVGDEGDAEGDGSTGAVGHVATGTARVDGAIEWCAKVGGADAAAVLAVLPARAPWPGSALASDASELRLLVAKLSCVPAAVSAPAGPAARLLLKGDAGLPFVPTHDADPPASVVAGCGARAWRERDVRRATTTWEARGLALVDALGCGVHANAGTSAEAHAALRRLVHGARSALASHCIAKRGAEGDVPPGVRDPAWATPGLLSFLGAAPPEGGVTRTETDVLRATGMAAAPGTLLSAFGVDCGGTGDAYVKRAPRSQCKLPAAKLKME
jgi:hypothetical protein